MLLYEHKFAVDYYLVRPLLLTTLVLRPNIGRKDDKLTIKGWNYIHQSG